METGLLSDELAPRLGEAKRRRRGITTETPLDGLGALPGIVKDLFVGAGSPAERKVWVAPEDPLLAPVGGLSWAQYVGVCAQIDGRSTNEGNDALAQQLGAPPGAWQGGAIGWQQRVSANPMLSNQFGEDVAAVQRGHRDH